MGFKRYLSIGLILLDLIILIFIIDLMGIKQFAIFSVSYIIGLILWSILARLTGALEVESWQEHFQRKVNYTRAAMVIIIILFGLFSSILAIKLNYNITWYFGLATGIFVTWYLINQCKDFLYMLHTMGKSLDSMLIKKYPKWFK